MAQFATSFQSNARGQQEQSVFHVYRFLIPLRSVVYRGNRDRLAVMLNLQCRRRSLVVFRVLLTTYWLALGVTGFNPCCCSAARLVSAVRFCVSLGADSTGSSDCCCDVMSAGSSSRRANQSGPCAELPSSSPAPHHCQCTKSPCSSVPEKICGPSNTTTFWLGHLAQCDELKLYTMPVHQGVSCAELYECNDSAFPSAHDMCVVLCSWRS